MIDRIVLDEQIGRILMCLTFLVCFHKALSAQEHTAPDAQASLSNLHVKHILGFEGVSRNANGELSIQDGYLRFQNGENSSAQIKIDSIRDLSVGEQDKQMGGVPMTLAKTAAPFGGGRAIALFSHKKYDTVTVEYVDPNGGLHGAIFELNSGKGQVLRSELETADARISRAEAGTVKGSTQQSRNEPK